ncbi:MAG TPA: hypothetical protein VJ654_14650 [Noviherbaspirillum sp.]|nr:hypothetical protein [Noviherbaspirillum sp.]
MTDLEELKTLLRETYIDTGMVLLKTAQDAIEQLQFTIARQARAAKMGMDAAKSSAQAMLTEANKARAESSPDALASERAANAALTDQIERLQRELEEARRDAERFAWTVANDDNAEAVYAMVLNHGPWHIGTIRLEIDAARQQYECNACDWKGKLADTVMLGGIGPLCPECRETTDKIG